MNQEFTDWLSYDEGNDILTIHGIKYSGELIRGLSGTIPVNSPFVIRERQDDGVLVVYKLSLNEVPIDHLELLKKYMREVYDTEGEAITERVILYAEIGGNYRPEELALLRSIQAEVCND